MGREFRGSQYYRSVCIGKRTIKDGEAAVVWNRHGRHRVVKGPYLKRMFFTQINFMDRYMCSDCEYLEIKFKDGHKEVLQGPRSEFANPVKVESIQIRRALKLKSASECVVVYHHPPKQDFQNIRAAEGAHADELPLVQPAITAQEAQRRVIRGPCIYFPRVGDTIEEFGWLRDLGENRPYSHMKAVRPTYSNRREAIDDMTDVMVIPLSIISMNLELPLQILGFDFGALNVNIRYRIANVEKLLGSSANPIQDTMTSLKADIAEFTSLIAKNVEVLRSERQSEETPPPAPPVDTDAVLDADQVVLEQHALLSQQSTRVKTSAPPTFKEILFVLENELSNSNSELRRKLSNMACYSNLQQSSTEMGIEVHNVAFLEMMPSDAVKKVRADIALRKAKKVQEEEDHLRNQKRTEYELESSKAKFEAAMTEQKQKLASQREHMQTEHELENQQLQHRIELQRKQHEQDSQLEKDRNDELIRLMGQLRAADKQIDLTPLVIHACGGEVSLKLGAYESNERKQKP